MTIVHEGEGVLFLNEGKPHKGSIMLDGRTYDLFGFESKSVNGTRYIQITARERLSPPAGDRSNMPVALPSRSRLAKCERADIGKYAARVKR